MDDLIIILVQWIISLFSGSGKTASPAPPPRAPQRSVPQQPAGVPSGPPGRTGMKPPAYRPGTLGKKAQPSQRARQQSQRQQGRRGQQQRRPAPPPVPQAASLSTPLSSPQVTRRTASAPAAKAPAITAPAVRQLLTSRPGAMRTVYVLTEVVGKPLALRD